MNSSILGIKDTLIMSVKGAISYNIYNDRLGKHLKNKHIVQM